MQALSRVTHILHLMCRVQPIKDIFQFSGVAWLNTALAPIVEEVLKSLMGKAGDHRGSVTHGVTHSKENISRVRSPVDATSPPAARALALLLVPSLRSQCAAAQSTRRTVPNFLY